MKHQHCLQFILGAAALIAPACAQLSPFPLPPPVEKDLAARASNVTEVTLGKDMLGLRREIHGQERQGPGRGKAVDRRASTASTCATTSSTRKASTRRTTSKNCARPLELQNGRRWCTSASSKGAESDRRADEDGQRRAARNLCSGRRAEGADHRAHPRPAFAWIN